LAPTQRFLLVQRIRQDGWSVTEAAEAAGTSRQTAYKWLRRYADEGEKGLQDRCSRPHRIPARTPRRTLRRIEQLRRRRRAGWEIAQELGIPVSTVSKHLKALGLGRIWRLEEELDPPQRYEHAAPGSLFHVDAKRFARIEGIGHRIHGNRRQRSRGFGWEVVFVCVDDHTRLAYAEVLPSENGKYAAAFFSRALRWFESLGIRCQRVLTDNAKCYTEWKAERFIQTLKRRWAYRYVYRTSAIRAASLRPWVVHYNHQRPHRALGKRTPMARLRETRQQAA
jgi:transposase